METVYVLGEEFRERHQVHCFGEPVHHREDDRVASGGRKTGHEVEGYVGPWMARDRERTQETSWGLV